MILAGILLKLGGYGLIRFYGFIEFLRIKNSALIKYLLFIRIIGGVLLNLICLRQTDLKRLIAYSSVVHMSLLFVGIISFRQVGIQGAVLIILAHGFISPALFFLMGVLYSKTHTRSLYSLKGKINISILFTIL